MRLNKPAHNLPTEDRNQRDALRQQRLGDLLRKSLPEPQPVNIHPPGIRKPGR